ncbi:MAG: aspartyl-phosphate phosphatase Spo0E family protein [Syntrophomonadaceae bacterium]|nr:aspartyl-phosphate phosphatase Spo0E family protein [Syntrophomonadaceae bacterium]
MAAKGLVFPCLLRQYIVLSMTVGESYNYPIAKIIWRFFLQLGYHWKKVLALSLCALYNNIYGRKGRIRKMLNNIEKMLAELEKTRDELHRLEEEKGLNAQEVIVKSQQLDELINRYYQLTGDENFKKQYRIA